jgi:hypothetical protein
VWLVFLRPPLPPEPLLFIKALVLRLTVSLPIFTPLKASVMSALASAIFRVEIPERYISSMASSTLPVILL